MSALSTYAGAPYAAGGAVSTPATPAVPDLPILGLFFAPTSPVVGTFPDWVDITSRILTRTPLRWRRGRDHQLDETTAGTFSVELDNSDRAFDPSYDAGPWFGDLGPNRMIQLRATWDGLEYVLWTGIIDGLAQRYVRADNHASVFVTATDLFRFLARLDFRPRHGFALDRTDGSSRLDNGRLLADPFPAFEPQRAGARIGQLLDTAGVDADWVYTDDGRSPLSTAPPDDDRLLPYLLDCARTDLGRFFISPQGFATFQDRAYARRETVGRVSQLTLSDDPAAAVRYHDIGFDPADERTLVNHARCGRAVARDLSSIELYGEQRADREQLPFGDHDGDAADQARYLVARYAAPDTRIDSVVLKPRRFPVVWPSVLGLDLGAKVTVERTPVGVGSVFSQTAHIEHVEHVVDLGRVDWSVRWSLSPADETVYFRLDYTDGTSRLDSGVLVGY